MKEKKLYDAITNIEDDLIENAENKRKAKTNPRWAKVVAIAACAAIIISAALILPKMSRDIMDTPTSSISKTNPRLEDDLSDAEQSSQINSNSDTSDHSSDAEQSSQGSLNPDLSSNSSNAGQSSKNINLKKALAEVTLPKAYEVNDYNARKELKENYPVDENFYKSIQDFSCKTTAELVKNNKENFVYSPISLYYTLALTANGAKGETAKEMLSLLGVNDKVYLSEQCRNLYNHLYKETNSLKFNIANSIWLNYNHNFKDEFIKNAAEYFYSQSFAADFSSDETKETMAKWVSDNTAGLLNPQFDFRGDELMTILNTVYFNDEWIWEFDENQTAKDKFHLSDGSDIQAEFMNKKNIQYYAITEKAIVGELSMKNNYSMVFALPNEGISPNELISDSEKIHELLTLFDFEQIENSGKVRFGEVTWKVPKFDITSKTDLMSMLTSLGMEKAFSSADFTDITDEGACISDIKQEARLKIHEKGVEASAFTIEIMTGGGGSDTIDTEIILDRPFVYMLTDNHNNIYFIGICENPTK